MKTKQILIAFLILTILIGTLTIAKSYEKSEHNSLKEFFLNKLSPEETKDFQEFSELNIFDKLNHVSQTHGKNQHE
tara:strand:- start:511 stop:738 length:228 start_codon:yes stop_codon:yes gene_type:complete